VAASVGTAVSERARAWEELAELGVPIHSTAEGGHQSKLVHDILASVAEEESRQVGERVAAVWDHATSQGWAKPTRPSWGYRLRDATPEERSAGSPQRVFDIDTEAAPFVIEAFERVARGEPLRKITRWMTSLDADARGNRVLTRRALQAMLTNPMYVGRPVHGDPDVLSRPPGRWPALVSDALWLQAVERVAAQPGRGRPAHDENLLTGLLKCPADGSSMGAHMRSSVPGGRRRYRCSRGANQGLSCSQTVDAALTERVVLDAVAELLERLDRPRYLAERRRDWAVLSEPTGPDRQTARQIQRLEARVARANERMRHATDLLVDGTMERVAYQDFVSRTQADMQAAQTELEELRRAMLQASRPVLPSFEDVLAWLGGWSAALRQTDGEGRPEALGMLIDHVIAPPPGPRRKMRRQYDETRIVWTPLGEALLGESSAEPVAA
jgi:hypothetical protein